MTQPTAKARETMKFPMSIRADIPREAVIEAMRQATATWIQMEATLLSKLVCVGFLSGAEADGIKLPVDYEKLDFDSLRALCASSWWKRVERMINTEMTYAGTEH